jgi:hypothetical protein
MEAAKAAKVKAEDVEGANGVPGSRIAHTLTACCRCRTVRQPLYPCPAWLLGLLGDLRDSD